MNYSAVEGKIKEFESVLSHRMRIWLQKRLPKVTDDWWNELVINKVSDLQREVIQNNNISELAGLDLASILRVIDKNWFVITSVGGFLNNKYRRNVHDMITVRNSWAHITPMDITKEKIISDVNTMIELLQAFDCEQTETRPLEEFLLVIEKDEDIAHIEEKKDIVSLGSIQSNAELSLGSTVCLASNESVIGAVINISGNRYTVLIGNERKTYYKEQIKLIDFEESCNKVTLNRLRAALTAHQIKNPGSSSLYSLNAARIDFVPYQFRPALKMIKSETQRILIADDVGVGKTIEAGLILKELEARNDINSVLIVCPRALVVEHKWREEMKRFDEDFIELDVALFEQCIMDMNDDGEWPERFSKVIMSYSAFTERVLYGEGGPVRNRHIGLNNLEEMPQFDLVIVDEAHHIRNSNTLAYKGIEMFCENAKAVVFMTATPLQNSNKDLYTLLNLLRPDVVYNQDTFFAMTEPNQYVNKLLTVIRMQKEGWQTEAKELLCQILSTRYGLNVIQNNPKLAHIYEVIEQPNISREEKITLLSEVESLHTFSNIINRTRRRDIEDFCIRRTETVNTKFTLEQQDLYDAIIDFEHQALKQIHGTNNTRFMMCTVMRQAASCIYGLAPFLQDFIQKRLDEIEEDGELYELEYMINNDEANSICNLAEEIAVLIGKLPEIDPKFNKMLEIIERKNKEANNKIIVFSSFRHTLNYLRAKLEDHNIRVGQITGAVKDEDRREISRRFKLEKEDENAIDVLLFTEVGCEGLDYQFCSTMINYDLPWNPMRIEQRIGRIDRRGQKSPTVQIHNMITEGTIDAAIYDRCLLKIGVFQESIGDCAEILGDITDQITQIMFDSSLSEAERIMKLDKMADNDEIHVQELRKLEDEEKSLFGFNLKNYIINNELQDAENQWITPESIHRLISLYLGDFLGEGEYIQGKTDLKNLRLSTDKRWALLDDYKKLPYNNNNMASKMWKHYLKSVNPNIAITFDGEYAKENRAVMFLTQMHPLVQQAAIYESKNFACEIGIEVSDDGLTLGDYEFLVYSWKYSGICPDVRLIAISDNDYVQKNILSMLQYATEYEFKTSEHSEKWDEMDQLHHDRWSEAKGQYVSEVANDCGFRIEQLIVQYNARRSLLENLIKNDTDSKIKRMHISQLEKLKAEIDAQKKKYKDIVTKADIHTDLLVKGVLHIG